ncbi:MAG: nucleotide sugar dehydrogenase [Syntrophobacterales bacterium]|jgi:UDPglucose 6-dehydrogenase
MKVSVFGLGKLGLCTAACFAARGHQVWGYDADPAVMASLQARENPLQETGLDDLLAQAWSNLSLTNQPATLVQDTDISLIIVPTPSQPDGCFSNQAVETVLRLIGPALRQKKTFHVVDIVSTVMPGSCLRVFQPLLEKLSGKICGKDFGLAYNPEFIALGSVIHNFLNPDLVLIGASDPLTGEVVRQLYRYSCDNQPHFALMSLINAEITKLSLNCYVTMKITFANELAAICELLPGAEANVITRALGADTRIGGKCLKGGLGFGGPCFPRDNLAFQAFAREAGWEAQLAPRVIEVNNDIPRRLVGLLRRYLREKSHVALLGIAYKPDTPVVEESQALMVAQQLAQAGFTVQVHDPRALYQARKILGDLVHYCPDPQICLKNAHAIVLLTNWPIYARWDWPALAELTAPEPLLLDCWGTLKGKIPPKFRYLCVGVGAAPCYEDPIYEPAANL